MFSPFSNLFSSNLLLDERHLSPSLGTHPTGAQAFQACGKPAEMYAFPRQKHAVHQTFLVAMCKCEATPQTAVVSVVTCTLKYSSVWSPCHRQWDGMENQQCTDLCHQHWEGMENQQSTDLCHRHYGKSTVYKSLPPTLRRYGKSTKYRSLPPTLRRYGKSTVYRSVWVGVYLTWDSLLVKVPDLWLKGC